VLKKRATYNRGEKVLNKAVNQLFQTDKDFVQAVGKIARGWFRKFKGQYNRNNLFEVEDLEQEIWAELLESLYVTKETLLREADRICNKHRMRGDRQPVEIPLSQLDKDERAEMNNQFYGISATEDDYGEESFP